MKYDKFESRNFKKKQKKLCRVCKLQLTHKEFEIHEKCKYDDLISAFVGKSR
jgi:uncharacterized CHY-type Zn-finger protein